MTRWMVFGTPINLKIDTTTFKDAYHSTEIGIQVVHGVFLSLASSVIWRSAK
jgi:hypothetical protein